MSTLFGTELPEQEGTRLDSLSPAPVGYGKSIPTTYGTKRITTLLLAQLPIVETVHTGTTQSGGKGGSTSQKTTEYSYSCTFAVLIQKGPIKGVRRAWMNGKLFYENKPFQSGYTLDAASLAESKFTLYTGTNTQNIDPTLESEYDENTPAYRGRSYIVFRNIQLEEFGNRVPSVEVEVIEYGVGQTEGGTVYPYPMPLRHIVGNLCLKSGMSVDQFDVTELDRTLDGFSIVGQGEAAKSIKELMELYHFYPLDDGEKLIFSQQPTPLFRDEYNTPCLINQDGYLVNAYNDISGRQGYFPHEAGTSEGQTVMIRAACLAYQATADNEWKKLALELARPLDSMYGQSPPVDPNTLYTPHWLFVVKAPVKAQTNRLNVLVTFTKQSDGTWTGSIPSDFPDYGDKIIGITKAYDDIGGFASWNNPYASILNGTDYDAPESFSVSTSGCDVVLPSSVGLSGSVGSTENLNLMVIYDFGHWLSVSENIEAWPHWRSLELGEINCAVDTLQWALEAFDLLYDVTADNQWLDAYNATKQTIITVYDIDDGRDWIRPYAGEPFSLTGTFLYSSRSGFSEDSVSRDEDLALAMSFPSGSGECQIGRGISDSIRASDTHIRVDCRVWFAHDQKRILSFWLQTGNDYTTATRYIANKTFYGGVTDGIIDIPLSDFLAYQWNWLYGWQQIGGSLTAGTQIDVVAVSYGLIPYDRNKYSLEDFVLRSFRPIPIIQLPYTQGAAPYTANSINGEIIDWRGGPGIGYQNPATWAIIGDDTKLSNMLDFIEDSQNEYNSQYSVLGPFMPAYVWDRYDVLQEEGATPNTWTFIWSDPNTEWVGYTARVVWGCADGGKLAADAGYSTSAGRSRDIAKNFLLWLNTYWTDHNKYIPTNFPEEIEQIQRDTFVEEKLVQSPGNGHVYEVITEGTTASSAPTFPTTIGDTVADGTATWQCVGYTYSSAPVYGRYDEPHAASIFMRAAARLYVDGIETIAMLSLVQRCWDYLERLWANTSGEMIGTWSHNSADQEWFGFWSGEIVSTLSLMLTDFDAARSAAGISATDINSRLSSHLSWIQSKTRTISAQNFEDLIVDGNYSITRKQDRELPRKVEINYHSKTRDGDEDMRAVERRSANSSEILSIKTNALLDGNTALSLAYLRLGSEWAQRTEWQFKLLGRTAQPGDVVEYYLDNEVYMLQFQKVNQHPDGYAQITAKTFDPSIYTRSILTSGDPAKLSGIDVAADTLVQILDIPLFEDTQDSPGFMSYASPSKSNWRGGYLYLSPDDNLYSIDVKYKSEPSNGSCDTALSGKRTTVIDESVLRVTMTKGTLASVTESEFLRGVNKALYGNEIVYFQSATLVDEGVYDISRFLRGRHGTDANIYHGTGERFVMLDGFVVSSVVDSALVGALTYYKGVSVGQSEADITASTFTPVANRLKPLSVAHLRGIRNANGVSINWIRRTRLSAEWKDYVDAPLGESELRFRVYFLDALGGNVLSTREVTEENISLTNTDITDIYGSSSATVYARVAQISATVGDGISKEIEIQ